MAARARGSRCAAWAKGEGPHVRDLGRGHAKETRLRKTLSAASALRKQVSVFFLFPKWCAETVVSLVKQSNPTQLSFILLMAAVSVKSIV